MRPPNCRGPLRDRKCFTFLRLYLAAPHSAETCHACRFHRLFKAISNSAAAAGGRKWMNRQEGALVIGGDYRALGVVRSLGRRGIPVWVVTNEHRVATASRYALRCFHWP